ncbi:MAG: hypothetical protein MJ209_00160 [archaeon]|nr:hypothetical protein [archaeon]
MAVKELPFTTKQHFASTKKYVVDKLSQMNDEKHELLTTLSELKASVKSNETFYKEQCNLDINTNKEFLECKHIDGKLHNIAKTNIAKSIEKDYDYNNKFYILLRFSILLKELARLEDEITLYREMSGYNINTYSDLIREYMTIVHKKLILEGEGYYIGEKVGYIVINRCLVKQGGKKKINFAATKKRTQELKEKGVRIYNKEEADYFKSIGMEYTAEDPRVYLNDEYYYEIPLLACKLPNGYSYRLEIADHRHSSCRGKTNEDLIEECNKDVNKICELRVDLKTKLTLCDKVSNIYLKLIRNETQTTLTNSTSVRKDRQ